LKTVGLSRSEDCSLALSAQAWLHPLNLSHYYKTENASLQSEV